MQNLTMDEKKYILGLLFTEKARLMVQARREGVSEMIKKRCEEIDTIVDKIKKED